MSDARRIAGMPMFVRCDCSVNGRWLVFAWTLADQEL